MYASQGGKQGTTLKGGHEEDVKANTLKLLGI